jgi:hypothetical protein
MICSVSSESGRILETHFIPEQFATTSSLNAGQPVIEKDARLTIMSGHNPPKEPRLTGDTRGCVSRLFGLRDVNQAGACVSLSD